MTAKGKAATARRRGDHRTAAYWERIDAIVDQAPPLSDEQRAVIRAAFSSVPMARRWHQEEESPPGGPSPEQTEPPG